MREQDMLAQSRCISLVTMGFLMLTLDVASSAEPLAELHPTLEEFSEEIERADLVVRGRVTHIMDDQAHNRHAVLTVATTYKGSLDRSTITLTQEKGWQPGSDLIVLIKKLRPLPNHPAPSGDSYIYCGCSSYRLTDGKVFSDNPMAEDLAAHKRPEV